MIILLFCWRKFSGCIWIDGTISNVPREQDDRLDWSIHWWKPLFSIISFWRVSFESRISRSECKAEHVSYLFCPTQVRTSTVGCTVDHLESKIIDPNGKVVPIGEQGEICVRGYSVMHGYWDDEKNTREVLLQVTIYSYEYTRAYYDYAVFYEYIVKILAEHNRNT